MNILYIPTKDPRLTNGGNEQRTNLLWESLKRYGRVYTFLADTKLSSVDELIDSEHPIYKFKPKEKRFSVWYLVNAILIRFSLFGIYSRKVSTIKSPIEVFEGVYFDIVVARYVYPLCNYKYWEIAPLLIDIDDHPLQVYETVRRKRLPFGLKTIGKYVTKWQTDYFIDKSAGGWIANKKQAELLGVNYEFLPNIPQQPSQAYMVDKKERSNLFTVGAMGYGPNKEGVTRFLEQVWPSFHEEFPDVKYYIVGKGATENEAKLWNSYEGVKYLGFVDDLEALYKKTLATVVPVYSGGGTCIKTLEAMAYSRTCLSTKFGARGLSEKVVKGEKGILLFEDAESFINDFKTILDVNRREEIEQQGKRVVDSIYSVESFNKAVDDIVSKSKLKIIHYAQS